MNQNTRKILDDLRSAGLDTSSLEKQLKADPIADRQADNLIGGGILRQQEYSRYMNDLKTKEQQMQQQIQNLATLHDARSSGVQLPQQALDAIEAMEKALIETGEFDEQSVKNISYQGRVPLEKMIKDGQNVNTNINPSNLNPNPTNAPNFQLQQPNNMDLGNYVDMTTFRQAMGNLAYGDIATNMEIGARLDEVRQLGISVTRKDIAKLQENLKKNFEGNGSLDQAFEDTFEISKAVTAKSEADIEKRIKEESDKRVAEALKEAGIPVTKKFDFGRRHVIFDKNKNQPPVNQNLKEGDEGYIPPPKELPTNKFGDTEIFRSRRGRDDRLAGASALHEKVMEHYANDPTYVE